MLRWLTNGRLRFASLASLYDIVRLPESNSRSRRRERHTSRG